MTLAEAGAVSQKQEVRIVFHLDRSHRDWDTADLSRGHGLDRIVGTLANVQNRTTRMLRRPDTADTREGQKEWRFINRFAKQWLRGR